MTNAKTRARIDFQQRRVLASQRARAEKIIMLSQEPREFSLLNKDLQRFAIIGSLEFDKPMIRTALFFNAGHAGRHEIIIGSNEARWDYGWYNGMDELAHLIPPVRSVY